MPGFKKKCNANTVAKDHGAKEHFTLETQQGWLYLRHLNMILQRCTLQKEIPQTRFYYMPLAILFSHKGNVKMTCFILDRVMWSLCVKSA